MYRGFIVAHVAGFVAAVMTGALRHSHLPADAYEDSQFGSPHPLTLPSPSLLSPLQTCFGIIIMSSLSPMGRSEKRKDETPDWGHLTRLVLLVER